MLSDYNQTALVWERWRVLGCGVEREKREMWAISNSAESRRLWFTLIVCHPGSLWKNWDYLNLYRFHSNCYAYPISCNECGYFKWEKHAKDLSNSHNIYALFKYIVDKYPFPAYMEMSWILMWINITLNGCLKQSSSDKAATVVQSHL